MSTEVYTMPREHYLNEGYSLKSWLLTLDHKRIALLYLASITLFFFIGGLFAVLIRLELMTPAGDLMTADSYNKFFTMHGLIMIFFFLVPSIPAVLGNFLIPIMIGAKDVAFPKLNLASWYVFTVGGLMTLGVVFLGGVDTGFGAVTNQITLIDRDHQLETLPLLSKEECADMIWDKVIKLLQ